MDGTKNHEREKTAEIGEADETGQQSHTAQRRRLPTHLQLTSDITSSKSFHSIQSKPNTRNMNVHEESKEEEDEQEKGISHQDGNDEHEDVLAEQTTELTGTDTPSPYNHDHHHKTSPPRSPPRSSPRQHHGLGLHRALLGSRGGRNHSTSSHHHHHHGHEAEKGDKEHFHDDANHDQDQDEDYDSYDDEDIEEEHLSSLSESSFSYLICSPICSAPFMTALFVFSLETTLFLLIVIKLQTNDPTNPLGFPASVDWTVIITQFFALLITVCTQDDVTSALTMIYEGYHGDSMVDAFPLATFWRWLATVGLLMSCGILGLAVTFLLIVTSRDVVELLLNFTAIEFISLLDNGTFLLAQEGFLGHANREMTDTMLHTQYEIPRHRRKSRALQSWMLIGSYLIMVAGWSVIYAQQLAGTYTPNTLIVQFDDELDFDLGIYSGLYELRVRRSNFGFGRIRYVGTDGVGMLGYCQQEQAWTFSVNPADHPCDNFIAHSDDNQDFDITTTAGSDWFVTGDPDSERYYPMQNFFLATACVQDVDCGGVFPDPISGDPQPKGVCRRNRCECVEPFYGWRCDLDWTDTCSSMEADTVLTNPFSGNREYALSYERLVDADGNGVEVYSHAVWVSPLNSAGEGDVVFYTGLRWGLFTLPAELQAQNITTTTKLAEYFKTGFSATTVQDTFLQSPEYFLSDVMEFNTPSDQATPVDITWNRATRANNILSVRQADPAFICAICNDVTNPCANDNPCGDDGACQCVNGASGTLCRITPLHDGVCDTGFFNDAQFSYDGGDCCEYSCLSTADNQCGFTVVNETELVPTLFPDCVDPASRCVLDEVSGQCWGPRSQPLAGFVVGSSLLLSANGRVLVQSSPTGETVKVFDQLDAQWTQRGQTISDVRGSRFGVRTAITTPPVEVRSTVSNEGVSMVVAVGLYRQSLAAVKVYFWNTDTWLEIGQEVSVCPVGSTGCVLSRVSVGSTDETAVFVADTDDSMVSVYSATFNSTTTSSWSLVGSVAGNRSSVSEDGSSLAVVEQEQQEQGVGGPLRLTIYSIGVGGLQVTEQQSFENLDILSALKMSYSGDVVSFVTIDRTNDFSTHVARDAVHTFITDPTKSSRLVSSAIGPVSRSAIRAGFDPVSISADGASVVHLLDGPSGPIVRTSNYRSSTGWRKAGSDYVGARVDSAIGASGRGEVLAVSTSNAVNVTSLHPQCRPGTVPYRLSIPLETNPVNVSWSLSSFVTFGAANETLETGTVVENCATCYTDVASYGSTLINVEGCMLKEECLQFTYQDLDTTDGLTFFYLFRNNTRISPNVSFVGNVTEESFVVESSQVGGGCSVTSTVCTSANESSFMLQLSLDQQMGDTSWRLRGANKTVLLSGSGYTANSAPVLFEQTCVDNSQSQQLGQQECLVFELFDTGGDGSCCDFGEGGYSLFWRGDRVLSRRGDQYQYGERVFVGTCNSNRVRVPASSLEVTVFADPHPEQISWYLEDSIGRRLHSNTDYFLNGNGGSSGFRSDRNVTTQVLLFEDDAMGCLSFVIADSGGDGNSGYSLRWNGTEILSRPPGSFRYGERVPIGTIAGCRPPEDVARYSLMTVSLVLGTGAVMDPAGGVVGGVSFYLGDESGQPLNASTVMTTMTNSTGSGPLTGVTLEYDPVSVGNPSNCYTFTVTSSSGTGVGVGGFYVVSLGRRRLLTSAPTVGYGERVRFGWGCGLDDSGMYEISTAFKATVSMNLDSYPNETSWTLSDSYGVQLVGPNTNGSVPIVDSVFLFPSTSTSTSTSTAPTDGNSTDTNNDDECVLFRIEDSGANGLCCNTDGTTGGPPMVPVLDGNYSLLMNDELVYMSSGRFGLSETVRFGPSCNVSVSREERLTVVVTLDRKPYETLWEVVEMGSGVTIGRGGGYVPNPNPDPNVTLVVPMPVNSTERVVSSFVVAGGRNTSYVFRMTDIGGDGICCGFGNGSYSVFVRDDELRPLISGDGQFGSNVTETFVVP